MIASAATLIIGQESSIALRALSTNSGLSRLAP
jgi:hypothetical protein